MTHTAYVRHSLTRCRAFRACIEAIEARFSSPPLDRRWLPCWLITWEDRT